MESSFGKCTDRTEVIWVAHVQKEKIKNNACCASDELNDEHQLEGGE